MMRRPQLRRRDDVFLLTLFFLFVGIVSFLVGDVADGEQIGGYWASASISSNDGGEADITEVIDYDFRSNRRRGIFRDVPNLDPAAPVAVSSPTAPDAFTIESPETGSTRIRVGDPDTYIKGVHRYRIAYPMDISFEGDRISWNATGSQWPVTIENVELHLLADWELSNIQCTVGQAGSSTACPVSTISPGHVTVELDRLNRWHGVTISATAGATLGNVPKVPAEPTEVRASSGGFRLRWLTLIPAVGTIVGIAITSRVIRRAGRELVWAGGSADAAYGPSQFGEPLAVRQVDHADLRDLATIEFVPPKGVSAWQGGIIHRESLTHRHKVAWLLEQAMNGRIDISGSDDDLTLTLLGESNTDTAFDSGRLQRMFDGRDAIHLGTHDRQFAAEWTQLERDMKNWYRQSNLWDQRGERRRRNTFRLGCLPIVVGLAAVIITSVLAATSGALWLVLLGVSGIVAGIGGGMVIRSWELRVRTPQNSGLWILLESFRRFLHQSDGPHVESAAKAGRLIEYTAWAVALGEANSWLLAVNSPETFSGTPTEQAEVSMFASNLSKATATASSSSSSSSSGGGTSVGSGGGGGGGGSW